MVDISYGPEPGRRPDKADHRDTYLEMVRRRRLYGGILLLFFVLLMMSGFRLAESRNAGGFIDGLPMVFAFPSEVLSEAWEKRANIPALFLDHVPALIETLNIAAVATLIGALCAIILALLSTRGLARWPALTGLFRRMMDGARAIPEIVIALMLIYILGGGPVPAVAAIALHTAGALGKLFSEVAENADLKPVEGLTSVGASWGQKMWLGVIPQVAPNWLSYALLRFEINVRASAILGFVGAGGIGYDLKIAMQWGQGRYDLVVSIFLLLFLTIVAIDRLSDMARTRLVKDKPMTALLHATPSMAETVTTRFARRRLFAFAVPVAILMYLIYAAVAFDLAGIASRARMDNAAVLLSDFWQHKTHVTRDNRSGRLNVAIDGEAKGTYPADRFPGWIAQDGAVTTIDLGDGNLVTYDAGGARYVVPGYGTIDIRQQPGGLVLTAPQPLPDWINASDTRVSVTTEAGRFAYTRSKVETFRYQAGWALFFFTLDSPFHYMTWPGLAASALWGDRVDPDLPNIAAMARDFWTNAMWRHGDVFWAMFETILMAFLGTFGAAIIALPLGFLAASNMMPLRAVRFAFRRIFDFIRGVDGLIWTIVLARAFGPGPMTGALAILLTDTGSFGKMFSEALENIDEKQVEGVRSTGANSLLRARFGVIPQVMPVLLSQVLYFLESNTRSATVIGAIVGGGIGLLLTQAIQTQKDWEDVAWYMVLIVLMVMAMDSLSGWLRRKLIKG